ncbi:MAG TPA: N,N-dimethylformamidase beta subunit family domain-containing protein, partial [Vicinamibacterales bacterium]|nr:N,N-dimethylformamidase beta subunit family domain-containing protein [Vicinamibacterales bacterium]
DTGRSDLLFQTSDTTWQAYNDYGGASLYKSTLNPIGRAYAVSYNRPFVTRGVSGGGRESWLFAAEYPMIRWLEANGYDVSYTTGLDTDRRGAELLEHKVLLSVGHDEYWSATQRANVELARGRGVNLAFFSGNEIFWKTRWEGSIADGAPHRTLVSYKETRDNKKIDPSATWTGTWRDPRFSPPGDGGRPENALTGTLFTVNGPRNDYIRVSAEEGKLRFWRNTKVVANLVAGDFHDFADGILGYEWNEDVDNGFRPAGTIRLSTTTLNVDDRKLVDYGSTYNLGTATHSLTLYKHDNPTPTPDALVFSAGTVQWSWALDRLHDRGPTVADPDIQQATVNLLADMGVQPGSLSIGLTPATKSIDEVGPTSTLDPSVTGLVARSGAPVTIKGTAIDSGGLVGGVEVSVDGGTSWHPATGRESWTYTWKPAAAGTATILTRATDDSGNLGPRSPAVSINIGAAVCPCSIWDTSVVPREADSRDTNAVEVGVKFTADINGFITALRFYKSAANTGTHVGNLWTVGGQRLATVTFASETASGWQEARLDSPVQVFAGTTYIASYHAPLGHYARDLNYFQLTGANNEPLHSPVSRTTDRNGVFVYSPVSTFPSEHFEATNYWVDVVFDTTVTDTTPPQVLAVSPAAGATNLTLGTNVSASFNEPMAATSFDGNFLLRTSAGALVAATVSYDPVSRRATLTPEVPLAYATTYTATVSGAVTDAVGNRLGTEYAWSFSTEAPVVCPCTI